MTTQCSVLRLMRAAKDVTISCLTYLLIRHDDGVVTTAQLNTPRILSREGFRLGFTYRHTWPH